MLIKNYHRSETIPSFHKNMNIIISTISPLQSTIGHRLLRHPTNPGSYYLHSVSAGSLTRILPPTWIHYEPEYIWCYFQVNIAFQTNFLLIRSNSISPENNLIGRKWRRKIIPLKVVVFITSGVLGFQEYIAKVHLIPWLLLREKACDFWSVQVRQNKFWEDCHTVKNVCTVRIFSDQIFLIYESIRTSE